MLSSIILIPAIIALIVALSFSLEAAFLYVYIPVLFFLPTVYVLKVSGAPEITFHQATLIPILFLFFCTRIFSWSFSLLDFLIPALIYVCGYSEEINEPREYTRTVIAFWTMNALFPYIIGKGLIYPYRLNVRTAKQMIRCMFVNVLISLLELRFVSNPLVTLVSYFFPDQRINLPVLLRFGLVRIAGPFIQTIFYGLACAVCIQLNYWLSRANFWEHRFSLVPFIPFKKGTVYTASLIFGMLTTFSRGPILGAVLGWLFIGVGFAKHRGFQLLVRLTIFALIVFALYEAYEYYGMIDRYRAESDLAGNTAYRTEMNERYFTVAMNRFWWGWGSVGWPTIPGMTSVDNQYLFLFLQHGIFAIGIYTFIMFWILVRLLLKGLFTESEEADESALAFTLFAVYLTFCVIFINVFMGMQSMPLFFLFTGWAEGFLKTSRTHPQMHIERELYEAKF